jgi:hypothetical protein
MDVGDPNEAPPLTTYPFASFFGGDGRRESSDADRTAFVRIMDFSKPIVTTRKGSPSERRTMFIGTPSFVVTIRPNKNAKMEEKSTEVANQKFDPKRLIARNRDTKVKCMEI